MENPVLQTDCLTLRPLVISDLDDVFCWMGDERVTRYLTEVTYKAAEDGRAWISSLDGNDSAKEFGFELKETGGRQ
ncbi:MAG: GNAT family N-acetyltransferase [Treponema sp.]|nr:GNAT family N-acetyltransferase [Treponema sp.]